MLQTKFGRLMAARDSHPQSTCITEYKLIRDGDGHGSAKFLVRAIFHHISIYIAVISEK